jgi:hypothetical protein
MLCNGIEQKSPEARISLGLGPSRCTSLHNIRDGVVDIDQSSNEVQGKLRYGDTTT